MKTITALLMAMTLVSCSSEEKHKKKRLNKLVKLQEEALINPTITHQSVGRMIEHWPQSSKAAANSMITKYGLPHQISQDTLIWKDSGIFESTKVFRDEVTHNFPTPHDDVLEQVIKYKVPADRVDDLITFDGSLVVDRTRGRLISRNDHEEMNYLALNLADKIVRGEMSALRARTEYARYAQDFALGNANQMTSTLLFTPASETADADMAVQMLRLKPPHRQSEEERIWEIDKSQRSLEDLEL